MMKTTLIFGFILSAIFLYSQDSQDTTLQKKYHFGFAAGIHSVKIKNAFVGSNYSLPYVTPDINQHTNALVSGLSFQMDRDVKRFNRVFFGQIWYSKGNNEVNIYDTLHTLISTETFQPFSTINVSLGVQYLIPFSKENGVLSRISAGFEGSLSYHHTVYSSTNMTLYPELYQVENTKLNLEIYHPIKFFINSNKNIFIILRIPFGTFGLFDISDSTNFRRRVYVPGDINILAGMPATLQVGFRF